MSEPQYQYTVEAECDTSEDFPESYIIQEWGSHEAFISFFIAEFQGHLPGELITQFHEAGFVPTYVADSTISAQLVYTRTVKLAPGDVDYYKLVVQWSATILVPKPITASPAILYIIKKIITYILPWIILWYFGDLIIKLVFDWLKSMTTRTQRYYDAEGNLIEEIIEGAPWNILIFIAALVLLFLFFGGTFRGAFGGKRRRK